MENPEHQTTSSQNKAKTGFTLIEILIVLAIIAMVIAMGLPAIQRVTNQKVNSTARKFVGLVRTIRNDAILLNNVHRLAIDFEKKAWWVEAQREFKLLEQMPDAAPPKKKKSGKPEQEPPPNFLLVDKYSAKPVPLPEGVNIEGVLKEKEGLKKEGTVYINFFPSGLNDYAILYLMREGAQAINFSVVIRPTLGRVEIYNEVIQSFDQLN